MLRIVFLLLSSCMVIGCKTKSTEGIPYYNDPTFTPLFDIDKNSISNQVPHFIQDFAFYNQDSLLITQKNIENKVHVANFIFTSCGSICPIMTKNFTIVNDSVKNNNDVVLLSYSVTPWIDTPEKLKFYKESYQIENENWHFLTGTKSDIYTLARTSYFAEEDLGFTKDSTEFLHTEHFILVDKNKRIRGIYNGTLQLEMYQLIKDIKAISNE